MTTATPARPAELYPSAGRPVRPTLSAMTPERARLDAALLQDFFDDLPDPISVAELADVLSIPRAVLSGRLRRGALSGRKSSTGWQISVEQNLDWIASQWRSALRRRSSPGAVGVDALQVVIDDPKALSILRELTPSLMTEAEAVAAALVHYRLPPSSAPQSETAASVS